jgi:hypothetical protein
LRSTEIGQSAAKLLGNMEKVQRLRSYQPVKLQAEKKWGTPDRIMPKVKI